VFSNGPCAANDLRKTREAIYVYSSIEARSCNHFCSGKAINIPYSVCVCVSVVLVVRHGKRMRRIVICGPSSSTIIVPIIT